MKKILLPLMLIITAYSISQTSKKDLSNPKNIPLNKNEVIHNNYNLDNTINLIDADISPVYKGCEEEKSNSDKVNCLNTKLTIDTRTKLLASDIIKKATLNEG